MANAERIGLLFVHGIGQQKPFDHLRESVSALAELFNRIEETTITVDDRTVGWAIAVGAPTANKRPAPITLTVTQGTGATAEQRIFECHEVYWADLADRTGVIRQITFWFWALGQWGAPIYLDADAARLKKNSANGKPDGDSRDNGQSNHPIASLVRLPQSAAGHPVDEILVRLSLALVALMTAMTLITWTLAKRLAASLLGTAPGPTLIVDYVDKVRTYEEPAQPGDTALSDPGFPRRVGIRRRMITQMVAMGARSDLDGWYVLAHSLGSVVAYNGLTEIGHTLPNYLGRDQWEGMVSIRPGIARDPDVLLRGEDEIPLMMPSRPAWLTDVDVINRKKLFAQLRGFVTYGSPLDTFAAIWPRIVATAADRWVGDDPISPFPKSCAWVNLQARFDPVATSLKRFGAWLVKEKEGMNLALVPPSRSGIEGWIPRPQSYQTAQWQLFLYAHLEYLGNRAPYDTSKKIRQRVDFAKWLVPKPEAKPPQALEGLYPAIKASDRLLLVMFSLLILAVLTVAASALVMALGGIGWHLLNADKPAAGVTASSLLATWWQPLAAIMAVVLAAVLSAGLARWCKESFETRRLLKMPVKPSEKQHSETDDMTSGDGVTGPKTGHINWSVEIQLVQAVVGGSVGLFAVGAIGATWLAVPWQWLAAAEQVVVAITVLGAIVCQAIINVFIPAAVETPAPTVGQRAGGG